MIFLVLSKKRARGRKAIELSNEQKEIIKGMRKKYRWGAEVIQIHLKYDHNIHLTKYKIERYLERSGLRDLYPCTTKKRKSQKKNKHTKKVFVANPGEHTQIDTKHQPNLLENGKKSYVLNFIDHASNWSYKRAYEKNNAKSSLDFLDRVLKNCPFEIKRIQTDNGTEFTYKYYKRYVDVKKDHPFEEFCKENGIIHKLIPPGEKELQGLVERSHRQDDQELFSRISPREIREFNMYLDEYTKERNEGRRFKKLEWKTPNEWLKNYLKVSIALASILKTKHAHRKKDERLFLGPRNKKMTKSFEQMSSLANDLKINDQNDDRENTSKKVA